MLSTGQCKTFDLVRDKTSAQTDIIFDVNIHGSPRRPILNLVSLLVFQNKLEFCMILDFFIK